MRISIEDNVYKKSDNIKYKDISFICNYFNFDIKYFI